MVCRDFILPESANYVSFYPSSFLRNLSYLIQLILPYLELCVGPLRGERRHGRVKNPQEHLFVMLLGIHFVRLFCVLPSFFFTLPLGLLNGGGISGQRCKRGKLCRSVMHWHLWVCF